MVMWLDRLLRRGRQRAENVADQQDVPYGLDLWDRVVRGLESSQNEPSGAARSAGLSSWDMEAPLGEQRPVSLIAPVAAAATAAPAPRFSAWQKLAGDPGADALRAQWEARWDEF
jgi:hypothetical protein